MGPTSGWADSTVEAIKAILEQNLSYHETASRIKAVLSEEEQTPELALVKALNYHPMPYPDASDAGSRVYSPMFELAGRIYPERVEDATEVTLQAWADAFELFSAYPLITARAGDLLWLRQFGEKPYTYAQAALAAMRSLWGYPGLEEVYQADNLVRALDLACELKSKTLIVEIAEDMVAAASSSLQGSDWTPGVEMRLIERLVLLPKRQRPAGLENMLAVAVDTYANDPFLFAAALKCQLRLDGDDSEARRATALRIIRSWTSAAETAEPLVAQKHLEQALEIAVAEGVGPEEIDRLRVQLQTKPVRDSDLAVIAVDMGISADLLNQLLEDILAGDTPSQWLIRLGAYCPVQEDRSAVEEFVRTLIQQNAFEFLASTSVLNADGLPTKFLSTDEEKFEFQVKRHDERIMLMWGYFMDVALQQALKHEQRLTAAHLVDFLSRSFFGADLAAGIGRAFDHYAAGRFEEALFCCLPRIEAGIRAAARTLGIVIFTEPGTTRSGVGGYKTLGELLEALTGRVPENHRRYLQLLLANPLSFNLRNRAFHGLMQEVSSTDAALVLHAAMLMGLWRETESSSGDESGT